MSTVSAALLLAAIALMAASAAASYECLSGNSTASASLRQATLLGLAQPMPGCTEFKHYCRSVILLYPQAGGTVYITVAKPGNCQRSKAQIVRAAEDAETPRKELSHCLRLDVSHVIHWLHRGYEYKPLAECVENICTALTSLQIWQVRQRRFCRHYFQE
uniref:Saposin B-type domain-containing protein n=1 Tax=Macrostomum lignano TaxID=282301 RepID=A0A1I8J3Z6_9PLAT